MAKKLKAIAASVPTLIALTVCLFVAVVVLAAMYVQEVNRPSSSQQANTRVSVGMYAYDFEDGKATRVDDEVIDKLESKLVESAEKETNHGDNCPTPTYIVNVMNEEKTQALVKYGCDGPSAQLHAKYVDEEWDFISPTNKFDNFGIPECGYVDENELDIEVAPVCYKATEDKLVYSAR